MPGLGVVAGLVALKSGVKGIFEMPLEVDSIRTQNIMQSTTVVGSIKYWLLGLVSIYLLTYQGKS